jgi:hypothetical protein
MSQNAEPPPESDASPSGDFEEFIKNNYGETKEFGKMFITFLSGILLFSINFSDKVAAFRTLPLTTDFYFLHHGRACCNQLWVAGSH